MKSPEIYINTRVLQHKTTGVQRYVIELIQNFKFNGILLAPKREALGATGHLWEQTALYLESRSGLLFSPANTGPVNKRNQVVTVHDLAVFDHPEWFNRRFAIWYQLVIGRLVRNCRHIIVVSEFTRDRMLELFPVVEGRLTCIPNGVSLTFTPKSKDSVQRAISELCLPTNRYVLALGSIEPRKNIDRLIKAWSLIVNDIPNDIWLVIVGARGSSRVFSGTEAGGLPERVYFTGYVAENYLPDLYSGAIVFVYPSLYEGFGLPPLEAMTCGAAVITSRGTAMEEVVKDSALLIDPTDSIAIAGAIEGLLRDHSLRRLMSKNAVDRASRYSWQRTAKITENLLLSL